MNDDDVKALLQQQSADFRNMIQAEIRRAVGRQAAVQTLIQAGAQILAYGSAAFFIWQITGQLEGAIDTVGEGVDVVRGEVETVSRRVQELIENPGDALRGILPD